MARCAGSWRARCLRGGRPRRARVDLAQRLLEARGLVPDERALRQCALARPAAQAALDRLLAAEPG